MRRVQRWLLVFGVIGLTLLAPLSAGATSLDDIKSTAGSGGGSVASQDQTKHSDVTSVVKTAINLILWAIGITAVIMIIISGLQFITSSGNPEGAKRARGTLTGAVIGLAVAVIAYAVVQYVFSLFK